MRSFGRPDGLRRRAVLGGLAGLGAASSGGPDVAAASELSRTWIAGHWLVAHVPDQSSADTALILLLPGLGPPRSPAELAAALPPVAGAVSLYVPLPFTPDAPGGFAEALGRRQAADYAGALLVPLLRAAQAGMETIVAEATERYGLSQDRPVHLFGFSMGGAAVLAALRRTRLQPRSVTAVNAPMSVRSAVAAYERKLRTGYVPSDPGVLDAYDVVAEAAEIRRRNPHLRLQLVQAANDDQFSVAEAGAAVAALNGGGRSRLAALTVLPRGGHNALAESPETQARVRGILQDQVAGR